MKDFRDPLYGFVTVDDLELKIIELPSFQRLRHIGQLGTTFLVYPSASHSRFEHSVGTVQASTIVFDRLIGQKEARNLLNWSEDQTDRFRRVLRLASLLHDIGHSPFSHAAEELFPAGMKHETFTARIIRETAIAGMIDQELGEGTTELVAAIAASEDVVERDAILLKEILTGDIGSDRLDYLRRDSLHLGVAYGQFDIARYVLGLQLLVDPDSGALQLMIEDGAVQAVEGILLARYFMFLQVYFHKTRRVLDHHLVEALKQLLPLGEYPENLLEYLQWDDNRILSEFRVNSDNDLVRRVLSRRFYRSVFETLEHPEPQEIERYDWLRERVTAVFGADSLFFDEATKDPYNFVAPPIQVRSRKGPKGLQERSSLVRSLKPITKMRIYAHPDRREEVKNECEQFEEERRDARD
jgi:HD superfamily phosphohydrolase